MQWPTLVKQYSLPTHFQPLARCSKHARHLVSLNLRLLNLFILLICRDFCALICVSWVFTSPTNVWSQCKMGAWDITAKSIIQALSYCLALRICKLHRIHLLRTMHSFRVCPLHRRWNVFSSDVQAVWLVFASSLTWHVTLRIFYISHTDYITSAMQILKNPSRCPF